MRNSKSSMIWGIIIVLLGVIYLGNNLGAWDINIFFDGWWTMFIIIPSLLGLLRKEGFTSSILGISIGVLLLLACQDTIDWSMVGKIFIPILLIVIGLSIIFRPGIRKIKRSGDEDAYFGIFSSTEEKLNGKLKGFSTISVFGGVALDLSKTEVTEDVVIDCVTVFGSAELKLPNVNVKTSGVPVFGGLENKRDIEKAKDKEPTIYINYVAIFGGVDLL